MESLVPMTGSGTWKNQEKKSQLQKMHGTDVVCELDKCLLLTDRELLFLSVKAFTPSR